MADDDRLLEQIGKLIDTKLTEKLEPVNEQLETLQHSAVDVMQGQERIEKRLDNVEQGQQEMRATQQEQGKLVNEQGKKLDMLLDGQAHTLTILETLDYKIEATKQKVDKT